MNYHGILSKGTIENAGKLENKCSLKKYFTPIFYYFSRSERRVTIKDDSTTAISQEISVEQSSSNKEQGIIHILRKHIFGLLGTPPSLSKNISMSGSCHLDRASNVEIGVECQIFVVVISFNCGQVLQYGAHSRGH